MPKPLLSKLVAQAAIGFFCVLFGCIIGLQTKDKILLFMSLVIGACCLIRCISLHHLIHSGSYLTVEGYCSKREVSAFKKTQQIHLIGSDDREYQFTTDKSVKLLQGHYYRLYFRTFPSTDEQIIGDAGSLLGFEEISSVSSTKP